MNPKPVIVIPAYRPNSVLVELIQSLIQQDDAAPEGRSFDTIVVIDDGSGPSCRPVFDELSRIPGVLLLEHAVNLGKGQALKTVFNSVLVNYRDTPGVITMDADGQHLPKDVIRIARQFSTDPTRFILGKRELGENVPLRSAFGNTLTRFIFRFLIGEKIHDTQTGLRAIPRELMRSLLRIRSQGYEFELDMLIRAAHSKDIRISEVTIETVYEPGNPTSHFNPIVDSLKIYFVFFRFVFSSVLTAVIDWVVFWIMIQLGQNLLASTGIARLVAGTFNFILGKRWVFHSSGSWRREVIKYAALVALTMMLSYGGILLLTQELGLNVVTAKLLTEGSLFFLSFSAQRVWVFLRRDNEEELKTDWDQYYDQPAVTASVTRKITTNKLIRCFGLYSGELTRARMVEWGGANSCFFDAIRIRIKPEFYSIADLNQKGLKKFEETHPTVTKVSLHNVDILKSRLEIPKADICFSVGLIEHFDPPETRKAIEAHFDSVKPGGLVVITFPTPTVLYRAVRGIAELLGVWKFPDERPLKFSEVEPIMAERGQILHRETNWPIILTQGILVARAGGPDVS